MADEGSLILSKSSLDCAVESNRVHSVPCTIDHDGEANITSYFDSTIRTNDQKGTTYLLFSNCQTRLQSSKLGFFYQN